jgi:HTH-type transcriptional regulator, sugar sensing transcriptional regulator
MDIQSLLKTCGLNVNEARTYITMLELESASIRAISDASRVNRGTTHQAITQLVKLGLVHAKKVSTRETYNAESPERILDILRDKRKELLTQAELAKKVIPELIAKKARPLGKPLVKYYEYESGITSILKDVLQTMRAQTNKTYFVYSTKQVRNFLYRKYPQFTDKRIAEDIEVKVIAIGDGGENIALSERKWLKSEATDLSSYTVIYGDKVAQISISADYTPYGVVIEDKSVATTQKLLFNTLWKTL